MKKIVFLSIIICLFLCCAKETTTSIETKPQPPEEVIDPKLDIELKKVGLTSANVSIKIDTGTHTISSYGVCYDTYSSSPTTDNHVVSGSEITNIINLSPGTKYYARAYALTTKFKTFYSQTIEFTTDSINIITEVSDIKTRSANLSINVNIETSDITEMGLVYSITNETPTIDDTKLIGQGVHELNLLEYETTYYVRGYIISCGHILYSETLNFTTKYLERVTDYDGNVYRIIEMPSTKGPRLWLLDNFKGTHYANGDPIPNVTDDIEWTKLESGAYCYYDNNKEHAKTYGALYNYWVAVDPRGLIPGWHTPSDEEWFETTIVWGMWDIRGGKFKQAGTTHWQAPNTGATNETGFTALPAGERGSDSGNFAVIKSYTIFASSTSLGYAYWAKRLYYNSNRFHETAGCYNNVGVSIRLIKSN